MLYVNGTVANAAPGCSIKKALRIGGPFNMQLFNA